MKEFTVSKLECMAIRKKEWLFKIMLLDYEILEKLGFNEQARDLVEKHNNKEKKKWFSSKTFLIYDDAITKICDLPENRKIIDLEKNKIKERARKYELIEDLEPRNMYEDHEIIIKDKSTNKLYKGFCNNYGGANWPPVVFKEIICVSTDKSK